MSRRSVDKGAPNQAAGWIPIVRSTIAAAAWLALVVSTPTRGESDAANYVGSTACGACHAEQLTLWTGSHHDRAMEVVNERTVAGNFNDTRFTHEGITSRFFRKAGKYFIHTQGPGGESRDFEVKYTFGIDPMQQYLLDIGGGRLQAFSVAWDTRPRATGGQRWFNLQAEENVAPGDPLHWSGPFYNWNLRCASCHSTNLRKNFDLAARTYDTTWSEIDVGCEACHGAGGKHVEWASSDKSKRADSNGLRASLQDARTEIETCAPCHSRRHVIAQAAQPGARYLEHYVPQLLREGLYFADGQIEDEVYVYGSFLQSKMHAAGVRCGDCHDPHSARLRVASNATCIQCHNPGGNPRFPTLKRRAYDDTQHHRHKTGSEAAQCVNCHMAARTYMVIDDRRDHSFRLPRPDLTEAYGVPNACNRCHAKETPKWAAAAVTKWFGAERPADWTGAIASGRLGRPEALPALEQLVGDTSQPAIVRATAVELLTGFGPRGTQAALAQVGDDSALVRIAAAAALDTLPPEARQVGTPLLSDPVRAVRIEAARPLVAMPAAQVGPEEVRALAAALDEYRAAQGENLDTPEAHLNLGLLQLALGEVDAARHSYESAIDIGPYFLPAYINLADLYRMTGNEADAELVLQRALETDGASAAALHALGLSLVRQRRTDEGIAALAKAAQLDPEGARYAYTYAIALHSTGKPDESVAVLQAAYERHPADIDILSALVGIHRERGEIGDALLFARKLQQLVPEDPNLIALVQTLEAQAAAAPAPKQ